MIREPIKVPSGEIVRISDIRKVAPTLPLRIDRSVNIQEHGFEWATVVDKPITAPTEKAIKHSVATDIDGVWTIGWAVEPKTTEDMLKETPWSDIGSAQEALSEWIDKLTYQIEGKYPRIIRASWAEEEAMALAFKLGTETPEQLAELTALGLTKGRTADEHADRVLWLAGTFRTIKGHVHNLWLQTDAALEAASSPLEYPAIFEAAKATAAPLAQAYGLTT